MSNNKTDFAVGLSDRDVERSRKEHGANIISKTRRRGFISQFLSAFSDPIIKILCAALAINILFSLRSQGWFETVGIALSIFMASLVSTLSEYGSESAFIRLQEEAGRTSARLMRRGRLQQLPADDIVVGDIVWLQAGERIPADGVLVQGELSVDQSPINGESREHKKLPGGAEGDRSTMGQSTLFRGTVVQSGEGVMQVQAVGDGTVFGQLAASLQEMPRESPLKARLGKLAKTLSYIGYAAAALVALADLFIRIYGVSGGDMQLAIAELSNFPHMVQHLLHALTLAISIVIMAVPEGLPMMITVVLSKNMFKMLSDKVMVRKLAGIETAGSMNILFTDKTGTLTRGRPEVENLIWHSGEGMGESIPPSLREILYISGFVNTSSSWVKNSPTGGNATDRVLMKLARQMSQSGALPQRLEYMPFDSERKFSAAKTSERVYIKGAPEKLLPKCTHYRAIGGEMLPMSAPDSLLRRVESEGARGKRVLCVCTSPNMPADGVPDRLCFECLAVVSDPLRKQAAHSVAALQNAGVQVVMVTGDSKATAVNIAKSCGILHSSSQTVLTGEQLQKLTDSQLTKLLPSLAVVSRALPGDKSRLCRLSQSAGYVCGMTGDGINDAPALRIADVGFAMGSGTEVAKEAGDIIITDDNISSICRAVLYGRTILRSIQRFIVFQLTVNLCAVGISVIGPFIGIETPVTVAQILWINMIMDTLGGLAFAGEPPLSEYMLTAPDSRTSPLLTGGMKEQIAFITLYTVALYVFFLCSEFIAYTFHGESLLTGFFALFIFCGIASAICARTVRANIFYSLSRNRSFIAIMASVTAVQLVLIYFGGRMFRTSGLSLGQLALVTLLSLTVIPADSMRKLLRNRKKDGKI
ncbi:MAG: calcium-translocating P-type ATPase, PMCA-type [Clostridia bacterium]|nr:calcium-translocating P-type ATPase, PMCA-type [Clostridia bacterium]